MDRARRPTSRRGDDRRALPTGAEATLRGALSLSELRSIPEMRERFGVRERLEVLHRLPMHHVAHGELDDLVRLGARNIGYLHDFRGHVPRGSMGANLVLDLRDQPVFESKSLTELHEQHHAHVADLAWRPGLADHERLDHLLQLLDLAVDLGRSDAHAARVEHCIRSAVDDHAVVPGDLAPVAVGPDPGKSIEVGGPVSRFVGVVPESERQRWKWPRAYELALLLFYRAAAFVEYLDLESERPALDFAAPHRQDRVSQNESSEDVGAPRDRREAHVALDRSVNIVEALGGEGRAGREHGAHVLEPMGLARLHARLGNGVDKLRGRAQMRYPLGVG